MSECRNPNPTDDATITAGSFVVAHGQTTGVAKQSGKDKNDCKGHCGGKSSDNGTVLVFMKSTFLRLGRTLFRAVGC
jgi:hypothetical protein